MACLKRWRLRDFPSFIFEKLWETWAEIKVGEVRRECQDLQTQVKRISDFSGTRLRISISRSMGKLSSFDDDLEAFVCCELKELPSIMIKDKDRTSISAFTRLPCDFDELGDFRRLGLTWFDLDHLVWEKFWVLTGSWWRLQKQLQPSFLFLKPIRYLSINFNFIKLVCAVHLHEISHQKNNKFYWNLLNFYENSKILLYKLMKLLLSYW